MKNRLLALLEANQQNAVSDILKLIKDSGCTYNKVLYTDLSNMCNPMQLSMMAHSIVSSAKMLINSVEGGSIPEQGVADSLDIETALMAVIKNYKSKYADNVNGSKALLQEYREYKTAKATNDAFDVSNRVLGAIQKKVAVFLAEVESKRLDTLEKDAKKVEELLDGMPEYADLDAAYVIAQGYGYTDDYCDRNLHNSPNDISVKAKIAEKIEAFMGTLK